MRILFKASVFFLISAAFVYLMSTLHFIEFDSIKSAFFLNKKSLFLVAVLQILTCVFMTCRYFYLLNIFRIHADFSHVTAATFVSNALGLWLPGSMAFIEIIRIGLMMGSHSKKQQRALGDPLSGLRARLTLVSLVDRLLGLWSMLAIGIVLIVVSFFRFYHTIPNKWAFLSLAVFSFILFLGISLCPLLAGKVWFRKVFAAVEQLCLRSFKKGFLHKLTAKVCHEMRSLFDATTLASTRLRHFWKPLFYSFLCVLVQSVSTYYAALAIGNIIPYWAILATVPILAIATLLPLGFGGVGGMQVVAAISLSIFGVRPQDAASAQLLQTAINILSVSFVALFFSKLTYLQMRTTFTRYQEKRRLHKTLS